MVSVWVKCSVRGLRCRREGDREICGGGHDGYTKLTLWKSLYLLPLIWTMGVMKLFVYAHEIDSLTNVAYGE